MEALPMWVQDVVALATVLSSIGVIIAIVQLKTSSNQFHQQLKITAQQFRLTNQGYLNFFFDTELRTGGIFSFRN